MKHVEVINLISSSPAEAPKPKVTSKPGTSAKPTRSTTGSSSASNLALKRPASRETQGEEWLDVSDLSDGRLDPKRAAAAGLQSDRRVLAGAALGRGGYRGKENVDAGIWAVEEGDCYNGSRLATATTATKSLLGISNGSKNYIGNRASDAWLLSDDSSGTIKPSDSFDLDLERPKKKLRLTPEPKPRTATGVTTSNGKGLVRAASDVTTMYKSSVSSVGMARPAGLKRSKTTVMEDDPIAFTSSPDFVRFARERREKAWRERNLEIDDVVFGDLETYGQRPGSFKRGLGVVNSAPSESESLPERENGEIFDFSFDSDLPDISNIQSKSSVSTIRTATRKAANNASAVGKSEGTVEEKTREKVRKAQEKARKVQEKLEAKGVEKERKRLAREEKAREKQEAADLAKVNMLRTDKKVSTPEMIVDLPAGLDARFAGQIRQFLVPLGVECPEWGSPIPNVIKWRRKVEARFNEELGHWEPTAKHTECEKHVMCVMLAQEFVDLTTEEYGSDLNAHFLGMKAKFDNCAIIYLIEGLTIWMRKNRNVKNRQFTNAVRSQMPQEESTVGSSSQRSKKKGKYVDENMIEDALLRLQVNHGTLIHHTACTVETAQWVMTFTQHISTIPYRLQSMTLDTAFCMESGQVKPGDDASDTFIKMLQEVTRITAPIAYGIAHEYSSAQRLISGFEKEGKDMLQSLRKSANKDGAFTDREIGKRISRRVYNIFMGMDEGSTDI